MKLKTPEQVLFVLVSYFPIPPTVGEMKTKLTQNAVRQLQSVGIQPDIIIARSSVPLDEVRKNKVSVLCNMRPEDIISAPDARSIYDVPLTLEEDGFGKRILKKFGLPARSRKGGAWRAMVRKIHAASKPLRIGIVGKYFGTGDFMLSDSYISVIEAVKHAAWSLGYKPEIGWLNAETYERTPKAVEELGGYQGIVVPGGFGSRGAEGKIAAIRYCRTHKIPYLGLCYGLQFAVVEFARNVCGLKNAHTTEANPKTPYPVISTMKEQVRNIAAKHMGGTMRLGAYDCVLREGSMARKLYGASRISERHRHRYEVNNAFRKRIEAKGLLVSGVNPKLDLVEVVELKDHPFFVGTQFHPELKSRPLSPHPLFIGLVKAAAAHRQRI